MYIYVEYNIPGISYYLLIDHYMCRYINIYRMNLQVNDLMPSVSQKIRFLTIPWLMPEL